MTIEAENIPLDKSIGSYGNRAGPLTIKEISEREFRGLYEQGGIRIKSWRH